MAAFNKIHQFVEDLGNGVHNFSSHTLKVALTNTAPVATDTQLADLTQIAATGGYTAGGYTLDGVTWDSTTGTATLVITDEVISASGGDIGPFRYVALYNDTASGDPLIGWWARAASTTLEDGDNMTLDFGASVISLT